MVRCDFTLSLLLIKWILIIIGEVDVQFTGFQPRKTYIYTLNGQNNITSLTCNANTSNISIEFETKWFEDRSNSVFERDTLHFRRIAEYTERDEEIYFYCIATAKHSGYSVKSSLVIVRIADHSTITLRYSNVTEVRTNDVNGTMSILIPVLTHNVVLTCNSENTGWRYTNTRTNQVKYYTGNELKIPEFTYMWDGRIDCTRTLKVNQTFTATQVILTAMGSAIAKERNDSSLILLEQGDTVVVSEDTRLLCASSNILTTNWYFSKEKDEDGTIIEDDNISVNESGLYSEGMVRLQITYPLPDGKIGYYTCSTYVVESTLTLRVVNYTIFITNPFHTQPTTRIDKTVNEMTTIPVTNTTTNIPAIPVTNTTTNIPTIPVTNTTTEIPTIPVTNTTTEIPTIPVTNTTTEMPTIPITNTTTKMPTIPVTNTTTETPTTPITNTTTETPTTPITNTTHIPTIPVTNTTTKMPTIPITNTTIKMPTTPITNTTHIPTIPITNTTTEIPTTTNIPANPVTNTTTKMPNIPITNTTTKMPTIPVTASIIQSSSFTNATTQVYMPIPTLIFLNIETLAPYIGAFMGLILFILVLACICIFCICCILKRRSKSKKASLVYRQLHSATRDQNLENRNHTTKYSQLIDPEAALTDLTCSASNEAPTSPNKKTSFLPQKDIETGASTKTSLETFIYDGKMSKTSFSKYQNNIHGDVINLEHYKQHLDGLLVEGRMEAEYKSLGGQELRYEWHQASLLQNINRNRYKRIYPYDRSRVVIRDTSYVGSDFINASHVPGLYSPEHFIAAQAPKPNTLNSFWQMIWEQRIQSIVMLTNLEETGKKKCTQYWPESVGAAVQCGSVHVSLLKEETLRGCVKRELLVDRLNQRQIKIKQFHYTAWPDRDIPELYDSLLAFIQSVKSRQMNIGSPVLVHCSGGVGGSGTFIALYNLLDAIGRGEAISVYRLVNEMREFRPHMVQTFPQYKYIYLATLEIIMGSTSIASEYFRDTYRLYLQAEEPGYLSVFQLQFEELNYQTEKSFNYPSTLPATRPDKNLVSAVLPYDRNRVVLANSASSDYINASYMNSQQIIATLIPNSDTVEEFLQLVHQLDDPVVVLLMTEGEYEEMREGVCDRVSYWREDRGSREFKGFQVETDNVIRSPFFKQQRMVISSHAEGEKRYFSQYISLNWTEDSQITDLAAVVTLLDHVSILLSEKPNRSAIFCCNDSIGKTGVVLAVMQAIRDMSETSSFDVFQTVKRLRNARKNTVSTIGQYISCYSLLDEYCRMNMIV